MDRSRTKSYGMLIGSMLIFGTVGIFRRYIPLSSALLASVRGLLGGLLLLVMNAVRGRRACGGIGLRKGIILAISGALMGANWMMLFEAYNHTTVSIATLCYYMEPTIVILFSAILFREKLTGRKILCALVSVGGMVLVSGVAESGGAGTTDPAGILLGLGAAVLYASIVLLNKRIQVEDDYGRTVIQLIAAALVMLPGVLLKEDFSAISIDGRSAVMILVLGFVHTGLAYVLYFAGMKGLPAQSVAILSYVDPVSALVFSALILQERMTLFGLIGAILIIGAALVSELPSGSVRRKRQAGNPADTSASGPFEG